MTAIRSRNFRIEDRIWAPFVSHAKRFGISSTALLKMVITDFTQNPRLVIGMPEEIEAPTDVQKDLDSLAKLATKAVASKKKKLSLSS